jgi:hypothetical protein
MGRQKPLGFIKSRRSLMLQQVLQRLPSSLSLDVNYQKVDMVFIRILMMCSWFTLLCLTGASPSSAKKNHVLG